MKESILTYVKDISEGLGTISSVDSSLKVDCLSSGNCDVDGNWRFPLLRWKIIKWGWR